MEINKREAVLVGIVLLVSLVLFFHNIPREVGDDGITFGISAMLINRAHDTGNSAYEVFGDASKAAGSGGRYLSPAAFKFMGLGTPLWTALLALAQRAFGVTSFWQIFLTSSIGFLTVVVIYFAGRTMYGRAVGLLSTLLLGSSLFFVIQTRSASGFLPIVALMTILVVYFVYTAHKRKDERYLGYSGLALGLAFFNGYPSSFLIIPILGFFFLWNFGFRSFFRNFTKVGTLWRRSIDGGEGLLGLRSYLVMVVLAVSLFVSLTVAWSLYANLPPLDTYKEITGARTLGQLDISSIDSLIRWKGSKHFAVTWLPKSLEWKIATEERFWRVIFLEMDPWESLEGVHNQQQLFGRPMVAPFATVFFFIGLLTMIRRRSMADKLCLVWLGVTKFAYTFPAGFAPRLLVVVAPVIYLTAGVGLMSSLRFLERRIDGASLREEQKLLLRKVPMAFLVAGLLFTVYATYGQVFDEYYGMDGNIVNYVGTYEVGRYIAEHTDPKDTLLVLGEVSTIPYDALFLYTSGEPYEVYYWWDDVLSRKIGGRGPAGTVAPRLDAWEREILGNRERIIYIFGVGPRYNMVPGWSLYNQVDWHEFKELHPGLQPVKRTYFSNGIPASDVYEVNRSTPRNNYLTVKSGNQDSEFYSSNGYINFVKILGGGKNPSLAIGNSTLTLPMDVPPSMEVSITYDENSRILFEPIFDSPDYGREAFEQGNLRFTKEADKTFLKMDGTSASLTYRIESPFKIERLDIRSNPRVFNDLQRRNAVSAYYSTDNREYKRIYEVRSSGNNNWAVYRDRITGNAFNNGIYERGTYDIVYPDSDVVYIMFFFEGYSGEAQLWSMREGDLVFDARVDTSSLERLPVERGLNTLLTRLAAGGEVTIGTDDTTIMPRVLEAEYLLSSTGILTGGPSGTSNGMAMKANESVRGYVVYGPDVPLYIPGVYKARFRIAALNNAMTDEIARIEVVEGSKVLKEMGIKGTDFPRSSEYQDFYLRFTTDGKNNIQYRVLFEKGSGFYVDFIEVVRE